MASCSCAGAAVAGAVSASRTLSMRCARSRDQTANATSGFMAAIRLRRVRRERLQHAALEYLHLLLHREERVSRRSAGTTHLKSRSKYPILGPGSMLT